MIAYNFGGLDQKLGPAGLAALAIGAPPSGGVPAAPTSLLVGHGTLQALVGAVGNTHWGLLLGTGPTAAVVTATQNPRIRGLTWGLPDLEGTQAWTDHLPWRVEKLRRFFASVLAHDSDPVWDILDPPAPDALIAYQLLRLLPDDRVAKEFRAALRDSARGEAAAIRGVAGRALDLDLDDPAAIATFFRDQT